jgi:hypothetical protein
VENRVILLWSLVKAISDDIIESVQPVQPQDKIRNLQDFCPAAYISGIGARIGFFESSGLFQNLLL